MARKMDWLERLYLPEMLRGMANTFKHMVFRKSITVQYPEQNAVRGPRFRGLHRLKKTVWELPDGTKDERENCVACFMCSTACPAECITIEAAPVPDSWKDPETGDPTREKRPQVFTIDMLKCIYCGMCEEACPCNAIELTTKDYPSGINRADFIWEKDKLLQT
jgi:NADH-quinone oxidoreductase subunit I